METKLEDRKKEEENEEKNSPVKTEQESPKLSETKKAQVNGDTIFINRITYPKEIAVPDHALDVVSITDLLDRTGEIENIVASSYVWDSKFVLNTFPWTARFTLISHWAPPKKKAGTRKIEICKIHDAAKCKCPASNKRNITLVHPPFPDGIEGNMHAKMILLCYKDRIRVIITSANLQNRDWDAVVQSVWSQDFYLASSKVDSSFGTQLIDLIDSFGVSSDFLKVYDFSTAKVELITSVPGLHSKDKQNKYGHLRLRTLLSRYSDSKDESEHNATLIYQTASVGALKKEWLVEFLASSSASKDKKDNNVVDFKILFPTYNSVSTSSYLQGARTICYWDTTSVTKSFLFQSILTPSLSNILLHSKVMVCMKGDKNVWVYSGSHNLSSSAWGRKTETGLMLNNYEIGVLFPPLSLPKLKLPFNLNPPKYSEADRPWTIPRKFKYQLFGSSDIRMLLFVLPQKHIFIPTAEFFKQKTGATLILPPQPCINVVRFGTCKYGDGCKFSHVFHPVELNGSAKAVFEGCRMMLDFLSMNPFSMQCTLFLSEDVSVNGWVWKVKREGTKTVRYSFFLPDMNHPFYTMCNVDVLIISTAENESNYSTTLSEQQNEISFLTGASIWLCESPDSIIVYMFGTKQAIHSAQIEIFKRLQLPSVKEKSKENKEDTKSPNSPNVSPSAPTSTPTDNNN